MRMSSNDASVARGAGYQRFALIQNLERNPAPEHLLCGGGIYGDGAARIVQKPGQLAAPHVVNAPCESVFPGQPVGFFPEGAATVFERMGFNHKMMVSRCAARETFEDLFEEDGHGGER